jgi:hypothetical protein
MPAAPERQFGGGIPEPAMLFERTRLKTAFILAEAISKVAVHL